MNAERLEDDTLQQYFDGELTDADADRVREEIETSDENRVRLEVLGNLHELIVLTADEVASDLSADEVYAGVAEGIAAEKDAGQHGTLRAIEGGAESGAPTGVEGWKIWIPAVAGLAIAAAVLFVVLTPTEDGVTEPVAETPNNVVEEELAITVVEAPQGSEVEEVDFGSNVGTVFEIEGEAGEPIAVVWINDDEPEMTTQ